jgi:hypothetical protein
VLQSLAPFEALKKSEPFRAGVEMNDSPLVEFWLAAKPPGGDSPSADAPVLKPALSEIIADVRANEKGLTQKYDHPWFEITGQVFDYGLGRPDGGPFQVHIKLSPPGEAAPGEVPSGFLEFYLKEPTPWKRAVPGDVVTVRCAPRIDRGKRFGGFMAEFNQGTFIGDAGKGAVEMTAEEFSAEVRADRDAAKEKFHDQTLVVSGKVLPKNTEGGPLGYLTVDHRLEAGENPPVAISLDSVEEITVGTAEPGESVTFIGRGHVDDESHGVEASTRLDLIGKIPPPRKP